MARATGASLTTAGFTQNGTTTRYTKTTGTAKAVVDVGAGQNLSGVAAIQPATPGGQISAADWNAHVVVLASFGVVVSGYQPCPGFVYYGQST